MTLRSAIIAIGLAVSAVAVVAPAEARPHRDGYHRPYHHPVYHRHYHRPAHHWHHR